jgi:outer membrane protein OmpA-like peptidoglycan-associated protein
VAENRRVEFSSNVPDILSPIILTAENQRIADPELIVFYPNVVTEDSVRSWTLRIAQAGSTLRDINGKGRPGSLSWTIKPNELSNAQVPVDWEFTVASTAGDTALATGSIPVEYLSSVRKRTEDLPDKSIDKYSLVLFDFDKSELTPDNRRVLEQMVLPSIKTNSKVTVIGYTDRIGGEDYNKKLSKERAEAVKAFLAARAKDAKYSAAGVGEQNTLFTQEQPIGRQLSRTVQVVVETPRR